MTNANPLFKEPVYKTSIFWMRAVPLFFLFMFLLNFREDVGNILGGIWGLMWGAPFEAAISMAVINSIQVLGYNLLSFMLVFFVMALIISAQALLPTQNILDVWNTFFHLLLHISGLHGLAVFVKDGKILATPDDWKRISLGVVVIDFNSAVVLEEQVPPPSLFAGFYKMLELFLMGLLLYPRRKTPRSCRAGITFTRKRERIRGVVDLRKQSRARLDVGAYTRDGIEMKMLIFTIFTLGQDADILPVSYQGQRKSEFMRVINWKRLPNGKIRVESMSDELDADDRSEIQQFAQKAGAGGEMRLFTSLPEKFIKDWMRESPLELTPTFNEQRVFNAIFTQARTSQALLPWDEMPANVSINLFREILLKHNFDEIFHPETPQYPLRLLRNELRIKARNNGILSFSLVLHRSGRPLVPGDYDPSEILVSSPRPLNSPKPLRERGIKILVSGFNDLQPVSEQIYKQRLENWRVKWAAETSEVSALHELEASRVLTHARKQGMEAMTLQLRRILETEHSEEATAIAVLQALEAATSDPKTRQLLPGDTISLLRLINNWLGAADKPSGGSGTTILDMSSMMDKSASDPKDFR
jgi:hypothetical protein